MLKYLQVTMDHFEWKAFALDYKSNILGTMKIKQMPEATFNDFTWALWSLKEDNALSQ